MKSVVISLLFLPLIALGPTVVAQAGNDPPTNQAPTQSKQNGKTHKSKPSAATPASKSQRTGTDKKMTSSQDAAYAKAYKAGTPTNKKPSPK